MALPDILLPLEGQLGLRDYEKIFCADQTRAIFMKCAALTGTGAVWMIVRPDQHIAHILPLTAHAELSGFFDGICLASLRLVWPR